MYICRQSIPDVRRDVEEANTKFDRGYERNFKPKRSRFAKSCPTTPRATTPTRTLSRLRVFSEEEQGGRGLDCGGVLADSSCNVNGTGQFYPEDDRYSFESRSLTAYSNYSERDSVINDNQYRYTFETLLIIMNFLSIACGFSFLILHFTKTLALAIMHFMQIKTCYVTD